MVRIVNYTVVSFLDQVLERDDGAVNALLTKQIQVDIRNDHLLLVDVALCCDPVPGKEMGPDSSVLPFHA